MLVIGRREHESFVLSMDGKLLATIEVVSFGRIGGHPMARLGITAPEAVKIVRSELLVRDRHQLESSNPVQE